MAAFIQDLRYGVRLLFRHRGFTVVAALVLAFGIGAIGQVAVQILEQMRDGRQWLAFVSGSRVLGGLVAGFAIMYVTGLVIG